MAFGCVFSFWALAAAGAYIAYGIAGVLWIMIFVCPHCDHYATRRCPCGYGVISARLVGKGEGVSTVTVCGFTFTLVTLVAYGVVGLVECGEWWSVDSNGHPGVWQSEPLLTS